MSQRTMKHNDWVKIAERKRGQSKVRPKTNKVLPFWSLLLAGFLILASAWNYWADSSSNTIVYADISTEAQKRINRYFTKQFMMGSWKLSRINFNDGELNVFIQIPTRLAMTSSEIKGYIQQSLCPHPSSKVWNDVRNNALYIFLYSDKPRNGDYALCTR
ncbi:hypothetical protein [Pseudoalteromonas luteoviolacea]|uniref:Uncharacterized protein n=1 Tax=Pseudoalteromonas luteoviolacea S4060-1 TaxID=1365257 RepID=A0A162BBI5_9GAMM|nr:hypothetical protein [Pseudoalteromonas luteoviolacea]KZN69668.1 hypothetical protein N478_11010 [Pseudoalteromonas luteoviolacea S4060-1]